MKNFTITSTLKGGINARIIRYPTLTHTVCSERNTMFAVTPTVLLFSFGSIFFIHRAKRSSRAYVCAFSGMHTHARTFWSWNKIMLTLTKSELCWRLGGVWLRKSRSPLSLRQPLPRVPAENRPCVFGEPGTRGCSLSVSASQTMAPI